MVQPRSPRRRFVVFAPLPISIRAMRSVAPRRRFYVRTKLSLAHWTRASIPSPCVLPLGAAVIGRSVMRFGNRVSRWPPPADGLPHTGTHNVHKRDAGWWVSLHQPQMSPPCGLRFAHCRRPATSSGASRRPALCQHHNGRRRSALPEEYAPPLLRAYLALCTRIEIWGRAYVTSFCRSLSLSHPTLFEASCRNSSIGTSGDKLR